MTMSVEPLEELERVLGYTFLKRDILRDALTHKSYLNEMRNLEKEGGTQDNERLEFLGDAVLDLVMSEHLTVTYPHSSEGDLSKMKARVVSEASLARVAKRLGLGTYLRLGRGEERTEGREKSSLLADALEAVIAAVYFDGGFETARSLILRTFREELDRLKQREGDIDYKTELQEWCQRKLDVLPVYRVQGESGPDHQKLFEVRLTIRGRDLGMGRGRSKKEAEQRAAKEALEAIQSAPDLF